MVLAMELSSALTVTVHGTPIEQAFMAVRNSLNVLLLAGFAVEWLIAAPVAVLVRVYPRSVPAHEWWLTHDIRPKTIIMAAVMAVKRLM